ncbi:hypothetical protein NDU88_004306 [Pleurodeles waltl]|uniref:Uncharacterized protein n=1 Tax=Pleurodeles waltl TaxID=8319 RepID=A0AAV7V4T4_PLEWA|nr:hypothetical protein NDU88_004306 [Pleurodeles waltl]
MCSPGPGAHVSDGSSLPVDRVLLAQVPGSRHVLASVLCLQWTDSISKRWNPGMDCSASEEAASPRPVRHRAGGDEGVLGDPPVSLACLCRVPPSAQPGLLAAAGWSPALPPRALQLPGIAALQRRLPGIAALQRELPASRLLYNT